jgi:hypothetical protein
MLSKLFKKKASLRPYHPERARSRLKKKASRILIIKLFFQNTSFRYLIIKDCGNNDVFVK